jgi:serine/threonine protein kinase
MDRRNRIVLNDQEIREVLGLVQRLADQKTDPATFHDLISQATPLLSRIDPSKELAPEHRSSFERTRKELADWGRGSVLHVAGVQLTAGPILAALQSLLRPPSPASQQTQSSKSRKSTRKRNGDWEVRQKIGEGGQGWVYEVRNAKDGKIGAMKVLKNAERAKRFRREVEACLKLDHRYIAKHLDHDLQASRPYLVTEYCEGKTLAELNREAMSLVDKLDLFRKICEGMALAHSSNVVHRDLKPANILFHGNGDPKVADFGICYLMDDPERLTETGEAVGPRLYMAPELEDGRLEKVSAKCDVYSLGKILYFILSGRYFSREKHREDEFDLSKMVTENTAALCHVYDLLDKSIVREPEQRFADAKELLL